MQDKQEVETPRTPRREADSFLSVPYVDVEEDEARGLGWERGKWRLVWMMVGQEEARGEDPPLVRVNPVMRAGPAEPLCGLKLKTPGSSSQTSNSVSFCFQPVLVLMRPVRFCGIWIMHLCNSIFQSDCALPV